MLVHGLGLSGELWNRVADALGDGYRLVRVDLRGAGRSRELERAELSLERWAADLGAVLDGLGIERPVVVGHSLGAAVALKYALERPDGVGALVLIGGEADLSNLAPRMLASVERIESMGLETLGRGLLVEEPAVLGAVARPRHGDPRRVPRASCSRTTPATTCASAGRSPAAGASVRPARRGRPARCSS